MADGEPFGAQHTGVSIHGLEKDFCKTPNSRGIRILASYVGIFGQLSSGRHRLAGSSVCGCFGFEYHYAMRGCELKGLRWKNTDLFKKILRIERGSTKTDAGERVIPLNHDAVLALAELKDRAEVLVVEGLTKQMTRARGRSPKSEQLASQRGSEISPTWRR